jgi:hypothetical protein
MRTTPNRQVDPNFTRTGVAMDTAALRAATKATPITGSLEDAVRQDDTPLLLDFMRDGRVSGADADRIINELPANSVSKARIDILLASGVAVSDRTRDRLETAFGIESNEPQALSQQALNKLANAVDDAQWAERDSHSVISDGDTPPAPRERWEGRTRLTNYIIDLVADGYMTSAKVELLEATFNHNPENKAGLDALLKSRDVAFLPGVKRQLTESFSLDRPW